MSIEKYASVWSLNHTYPLSKTNLPDEEYMHKCNHLTSIRPIYNTGNK